MDVKTRTTYTLTLADDERFPLKFQRGSKTATGLAREVEFSVKSDDPGHSLVYVEGDTLTKTNKPGRKFRQWASPSYYPEVFSQIPEAILAAMRELGYAK